MAQASGGTGQGEPGTMLGIDVSKDTLSCTLVDAHTRAVLWHKSVPNSAAGVTLLLQQTPAPSAWVLEPTGRYSIPVVQQAKQAGRSVLLAPPRKAKAFLSSLQSRAKTDAIDSRGLALFALSQRLHPYPLKSDSVERLDQLLSARKGLSTAIARLGQQERELPHAAFALSQARAALTEQKKALDQQISQ